MLPVAQLLVVITALAALPALGLDRESVRLVTIVSPASVQNALRVRPVRLVPMPNPSAKHLARPALVTTATMAKKQPVAASSTIAKAGQTENALQ